MPVSVFDASPAAAVTSWEKWPPLVSPLNQESPFLLVEPIVLQPAGPALAGFLVICSVFGLNPCHVAIERQMCFGAKQPLRACVREPLLREFEGGTSKTGKALLDHD